MEDVNKISRTELDSHANMPVIGRNAYILSKIGETVDVAPFTPDYIPISVELVDAALKYECPYSGEVKILIIRRGLHVPSMTHNLLPPFMLREAGIQINEVPKIHVTSPTEEHHAITFQETNFRIPLTLPNKKETHKPKKDSRGKGKTDMTKIKFYNCGEMGHFAWDCQKPCENTNIA